MILGEPIGYIPPLFKVDPRQSLVTQHRMASVFGLSKMSLRKFDGSNVNFRKEQRQDYLIVKGQIELIENEDPPEGY